MKTEVNQAGLPIELPPEITASKAEGATQLEDVRLRRPVRNQVEMMTRDLDSL